MSYQPKTGERCACRRGIERDNCGACEGTGWRIDFAAIRAATAHYRISQEAATERVRRIADRLQTDEHIVAAIEHVAGARFRGAQYHPEPWEEWTDPAWRLWDSPTDAEYRAVQTLALNAAPAQRQTLPWGVEAIRR